MDGTRVQNRSSLVVSMLKTLKEVYLELNDLSSCIENNSEDFYERLFNSSKLEIQGDIEAYKANIEKMKQLNLNVTENLNQWYDFIKDSNEIKKVTFPIKLHLRKKRLKSTIAKMNQEISGLSIENRFIREKIVNWEQELSVKALQQIKIGDEFSRYEGLIKKKDHLVSELYYLISTIPGIDSLEFELENIDSTIDEFVKSY